MVVVNEIPYSPETDAIQDLGKTILNNYCTFRNGLGVRYAVLTIVLYRGNLYVFESGQPIKEVCY